MRGGFVVRIHGRGLRAVADHVTPGVVGAEAAIGLAPEGARCAFGTAEVPALRWSAADVVRETHGTLVAHGGWGPGAPDARARPGHSVPH